MDAWRTFGNSSAKRAVLCKLNPVWVLELLSLRRKSKILKEVVHMESTASFYMAEEKEVVAEQMVSQKFRLYLKILHLRI